VFFDQRIHFVFPAVSNAATMPICTARKLLDLLGADASEPSPACPNAGNAAAWAMVAGTIARARPILFRTGTQQSQG
jgi:hypothetical protein